MRRRKTILTVGTNVVTGMGQRTTMTVPGKQINCHVNGQQATVTVLCDLMNWRARARVSVCVCVCTCVSVILDDRILIHD